MADDTVLHTEQLGEGPGNGGITKSVLNGENAEQLGEGPGNGGIAKSATGKRGVKRKTEQKTIETKYEAILEFEKGQKSKTEVAKMFGVPKNTLSGWIKKADEIKESFTKFGPKRRNTRTGKHEDLETAVLQWFRQARDRDIPVSGPVLLQQAGRFAEQLGIADFKESVGWLDRFKDRHGISFKAVSGEAKSVDVNSDEMGAWNVKLGSILKSYHPRDIYNADETSLFYRLTPDKTLEFKNVDCQGGKRSKERITVMVCANMSGDDKVPLLVIGKFAKPRCFKNVQSLPTEYTFNKKAWMTAEIFTNWLVKLDRRFHRQNRHVAMIIDNCPAHPKVKGLKAIDLIFLPPNTTSHTQPCDQGIIKNLKVHYRQQVILRRLDAIEKGTDAQFTVSVLDALRILRNSWAMVTKKTVANCFKHAGFVEESSDKTPSDPENDDDVPLARLVQIARATADVQRLNEMDLNIPVCAPVTESSIIEDMLESRNQDDLADDEDEPPPMPLPTLGEAEDACDTLRRLIETRPDADHQVSMVCSLQKFLLNVRYEQKSAVQKTIKDFFK